MPVTVPSITGGTVEKFMPADRTTWTVAAGQVFTGARLVEGTPATDRNARLGQADSLICVGLALWDGVAGDKVTVAHTGAWMMRASGAIVCGQRVKVGALGVAVAVAADGDPRLIIGWALADIANLADGPVKLLL